MNEITEAPRKVEDVHLGRLCGSLGFLLRLAQISSFDDFFKRLGHLGIRPGEVSVMMLIGENPGVRQGVLAKRLMIKRAHMTKMILAMERSGLVKREIPDDDRRSVALWLTDGGRQRVEELAAPFWGHEGRPAPGLTKPEETELKRLLGKYLGLSGKGRSAQA